MITLIEHPPENINLSALIEVLDTLKAPGVSENHINTFLSTPATEWKSEINRNQSANIDPSTANNRIESK